MTTPVANRPASTTVPTPTPNAPAAPIERSWGDIAVDAVVDFTMQAARPAMLPLIAAKDTYERGGALVKSAQVLRENTAASSLSVDESASTEVKLKAKGGEGVLHGEVAASVSVEKTKDGYTIEKSLSGEAGVALPLSKKSDVAGDAANQGPSLEGEAAIVTNVVVQHKVKTAAEADQQVRDFKTTALEGLVESQTRFGPMSAGEKPRGIAGFPYALEDDFAGAASVKSSLTAKASFEAALWKLDAADASEVGAELGLKVEGEHQLQMEVTDEDGKKFVTFKQTAQVASEMELGLENAPLDDLKMGMTPFGQNNEVAVSRSIKMPLPDNFDMKKAANVMDVYHAAKQANGKATEEVSVDVKTQAGDQLVEGSLKVDGGMRNAMKVAGAALGKDDATGIRVEGEVTRTLSRPNAASVDLGDDLAGVSFEVETEHKKKLESVKTTDAASFVREMGKKSIEGTLLSARLVNLR